MWNKQGRHVSESMRLNSFKKFLKEQGNKEREQHIEYKGFTISHFLLGGSWFIDHKKFKEGTRVIGKGEPDYGFSVKEYPYADDLEVVVVINRSGTCIRYASELEATQ